MNNKEIFETVEFDMRNITSAALEKLLKNKEILICKKVRRYERQAERF